VGCFLGRNRFGSLSASANSDLPDRTRTLKKALEFKFGGKGTGPWDEGGYDVYAGKGRKEEETKMTKEEEEKLKEDKEEVEEKLKEEAIRRTRKRRRR
jgi:hypothetical protein